MQDIDWDVMAAPWLRAERGLEMAHQVVLDGIMQRVGLQAGQRVLDIGCGTGTSLLAAAEAVGPSGAVAGIDIAPPLAARAQARVPGNVEVIVGDAGSVPHPTPFDVAISLFGTMFFADTGAGFANIRKAVVPGGRFVFAAWGAPPKNPWFGIPRAAVEAQVGSLPKPDPSAPGPFRFANAGPIIDVLQAVGWAVEVDTQQISLNTGQKAEGLADMHLIMAEAIMLANRDVSEEDRARIHANLVKGFDALSPNEVVKVPAEVHFFIATAT